MVHKLGRAKIIRESRACTQSTHCPYDFSRSPWGKMGVCFFYYYDYNFFIFFAVACRGISSRTDSHCGPGAIQIQNKLTALRSLLSLPVHHSESAERTSVTTAPFSRTRKFSLHSLFTGSGPK